MEEPRLDLKPNSRNLGILAIEPYFPADYVSHAELETFMKVGAGKFTRGIGQTSMSIPSDREDPVSMALTATHNLMERYSVNPKDIGRLQIGTESMIDRSRSMKSYLMEHIFRASGHLDLEGCTSIMACYGGTNAIFNSLNWLESSASNGKQAIVVMTDISRYGEKNSIPTMGAGALAILLGPQAPIVFSPVRSTYFDYADDFYKPVKENQYPVVNSQLSIHTYLKSVVYTFMNIQHKQRTRLHDADYCIFHAPFAKMVQKAFSQLYYADQLLKHGATDIHPNDCVLDSKSLPQVQKESLTLFQNKCAAGLAIPKLIGNSYTASLYFCFISLLADASLDLSNKNILFFSYGSGCAASLFSAKVTPAYLRMAQKLREALGPLLATRIKISPETLFLRKQIAEAKYFRKGYIPEDLIEKLSQGTYYLESIDSRYVRKYKRKVPEIGKQRLESLQKQVIGSRTSQGVWGGFYQKPMQERVDQV